MMRKLTVGVALTASILVVIVGIYLITRTNSDNQIPADSKGEQTKKMVDKLKPRVLAELSSRAQVSLIQDKTALDKFLASYQNQNPRIYNLPSPSSLSSKQFAAVSISAPAAYSYQRVYTEVNDNSQRDSITIVLKDKPSGCAATQQNSRYLVFTAAEPHTTGYDVVVKLKPNNEQCSLK